MQAASPGSSPALPKLLLYLLAVMLGGALLSAPLFHLGKAAHGWLSTSSLHDAGLVRWLLSEIERAQFTRYFNRAVLVCALVFIWPFMRWVRLERTLLGTGFLDPNNPRLVMRRLRTLFNRAQPDLNELNMLRGLLTTVEKPKRRRIITPGSEE